MPSTGASAPTFTATIGTSDHEPFDLAEVLGDGPVVLAFFPGAFTPPCTNEMVALEEHGLSFDLVSDMAGEAIRAYDLEMDIPDLGLYGIANRAVFVLDEEGTIVYDWVAEDPTNEPAYDELLDAVESA